MASDLTVLRAVRSWKSLLGILLLVACSYLCFASSDLIQELYPDRPIVPDLLFDLLPRVPWLAYVTDPIMLSSIILMLAYAFSIGRRHLPYYFVTIAFTYLLRAVLMVLTPLGRPTGNLSSYGVFEAVEMQQHGMFPSGHVLLAWTIYLLIDRHACRWCKLLGAALLWAEILTLLLSWGHYSIDIVGGACTAYMAYRIMRGFKERFRIES